MPLLTSDALREIFQAALEAGLSRDPLLVCIDRAVVAGLPTGQSVRDQIFLDLNALNEMGELSNGAIPLCDWLLNARMLAGEHRAAGVFASGLRQVEATRQQAEDGRSVARWAPYAGACLHGYVSLAGEDLHFFETLKVHLTPLVESGRLALTHRFLKVEVGGNPKGVLQEATIVLVVATPAYLASERTHAEAEQLARLADARVVPVRGRPCDWASSPLASASMLPRSGRALISGKDAYREVAMELRVIVEELIAARRKR